MYNQTGLALRKHVQRKQNQTKGGPLRHPYDSGAEDDTKLPIETKKLLDRYALTLHIFLFVKVSDVERGYSSAVALIGLQR